MKQKNSVYHYMLLFGLPCKVYVFRSVLHREGDGRWIPGHVRVGNRGTVKSDRRLQIYPCLIIHALRNLQSEKLSPVSFSSTSMLLICISRKFYSLTVLSKHWIKQWIWFCVLALDAQCESYPWYIFWKISFVLGSTQLVPHFPVPGV